MINKEKLKQLNPEQRIRKLKELQHKKERDSKEIEQLIRETEQEAKTQKLADDVAPPVREVDISGLFAGEGETLEMQVKRENEAGPGQPQLGYIPLEQQYTDYKTLREILPYAATSGSLTEEQISAIDEIGERLENIKYKTESKKAAEIHVAAIALHHKIRKYAGLD